MFLNLTVYWNFRHPGHN